MFYLHHLYKNNLYSCEQELKPCYVRIRIEANFMVPGVKLYRDSHLQSSSFLLNYV